MLKKFLLAAGLAAAFTFSPQVAEAKVKVYLGLGGPDYCYGHYDPFYCDRYRYYPRHDVYDPYPDFPEWVSCKQAKWIVRERGFHNVKTASCGGKYHVFIASKRGDMFRIRVYSRNGRIRSINEI